MRAIASLVVVLIVTSSAAAQTYDCRMDGGEVLAFVMDDKRDACRFGVNDGTFRDDGVYRISNPQQRRVTLDVETGAVVYEDTDNDTIRRGECEPA